ncbi:cobalamin biosynthesis protein CbiG [Ilumatobacter sp.]|uniref:cobalamin biosynthesis protein CbiG n=1 Tax=Ilumatobacter sp. TaxID=1967498 RepID=UPI003B515B2B
MFDRIVVVDWSASSTPRRGRDSIWICEHAVADASVRSVNPPTRAAAVDVLAELAAGSDRVLVGIDISLGYPAGTAAALGLEGTPWRAMWEVLRAELHDGDDNANDRFAVASELNGRISAGPGPFWGCPPSQRTPTLTSTKVPSEPLAEWRTVEAQMRDDGRRPFSCWQLLGNGAVASQSLVGIVALARLRDRLAAVGREARLWPLETGLRAPTDPVVVAEVWPSLLPPAIEVPGGAVRVRDHAQVETQAAHLADAVRTGEVSAMFDPGVSAARAVVEGEEGWVLGVRAADR